MSYYKESGKINLGVTLVMLPIALALISLTAYGYSVLTHINPFIYVNFLITIGYVALAVLFMVMVNDVGHLRNGKVRLLISIIISVVGLYAMWVGYISYVFEETFSFAVSNFVVSIKLLSYQTFSVASIDFTGMGLYILWGIEALVVLIAPIYLSSKMGKTEMVYCEPCSKWARNEKRVFRHSDVVLTKDSIENMLIGSNINQLMDLKEAHKEDSSYYDILFKSCDHCKQTYYVSVEHVTNSRNDKGKMDEERTLILPFYELALHVVPQEIKQMKGETILEGKDDL